MAKKLAATEETRRQDRLRAAEELAAAADTSTGLPPSSLYVAWSIEVTGVVLWSQVVGACFGASTSTGAVSNFDIEPYHIHIEAYIKPTKANLVQRPRPPKHRPSFYVTVTCQAA